MIPTSDFDPAPGARAAVERARLLVNRAPHLAPRARREANRAVDTLERQLEMNRLNPRSVAQALERLNRAHPSILFGLLCDEAFTALFASGLRRLGLRPIRQRLDEVSSGEMALPIPGPTGGVRHRDELPPEERVDAMGRPLPPPPGYY